MPNLPMHIHLAHEVAQQLDRGYVYDHLGCFYLGSTAPDIRAMTKGPREQTHFAPLSVEEVGAGARTMFQSYPELVDEAGASPATKSFLLGYLSHLAADETWITSVYRPNFDLSVEATRLTGDQVQADIWDRAVAVGYGPGHAARTARPAERPGGGVLRRRGRVGGLSGRRADYAVERVG